MKSALVREEDWEALPELVRYNVAALAEKCGVTVRQLERFFARSRGKSPHQWLRELRLRRAIELLRDRTSVKAASHLLGYKNSQHFIHDFKTYYGITPGDFSFGRIIPTIPCERSHFDTKSRILTPH